MPPETETGADTPPPVKNGARSVGSLLHASRIRCGEELTDISQILKVRLPYLEAIEEGRFGDLPGNTYAIGFIRAYADHLGLDSGEVVRRYKEDVTDANKKTDLDFPVPAPESSIPGGAILFIGVAIAVLAYGGWYASTTKSGFFAELISPVPEKAASLSPGAEKKAAGPATEKVTEKNNSAPPLSPDGQSAIAVASTGDAEEEPETENAPVTAVKVTAAKPEPEKTLASIAPEPEVDIATAKTVKTAQTVAPVVMESTLATPPAAPPALRTSPSPPTPKSVKSVPAPTPVAVVALSKPKPKPEPQKVAEKPRPKVVAVSVASDAAVKSASDSGRIVIRARTNSWIQIRDDIGNRLLVTRLLRSGDSYRVPDRPGLKLLTGNAGGLEIMVDGETVPVIGGKGAVRRSVLLDADRLLAGTAVAE